MNWLLIGLGVVGLAALYFFVKLWPKIKGKIGLPTSITNVLDKVSTAAVKATDISGVISSYAALTGIRRLDAVETDPKAIEACNYLREVITAWKRPVEEEPAEVVDTIESLQAKVAELEAIIERDRPIAKAGA